MLKAMGVLVGSAMAMFAFSANAGDLVSQAGNYAEFKEQFCAASRDGEHIFVVPAAMFSEQKGVTCADGESGLRVSEPADDPGHTVFNIDPPHGVETAFDCDGKADTGMTMVALNCIPASAEAADHKKT